MTDNDLHKGATEDETSQQGQLPHREKNPLIKSSDTDFPEPGPSPEHSGEPETKTDPEGAMQDQDPGQRQKRNHGVNQDDPLAA